MRERPNRVMAGGRGLLTTRMTRKRKKTLATFWNWNQRFFGTKDKGVYLAVRILLRVNSCIGLPSSSSRSGGNGRLKYSCRGPCSRSISSSSSISLVPWSPSWGFAWDDCKVSEPPDCLFFSEVTDFLLLRPMSDRRLMPLLLTVNLLVAHLERFVLSSLVLSGLLLSLLTVPSAVSLGVRGGIARMLRA